MSRLAQPMTPELIEAAARLCGWKKDIDAFLAAGDITKIFYCDPPDLTDSRLIDLETHLLKRGWSARPWTEQYGFCWAQPFEDSEGHTFLRFRRHPDRATAACMAAQKELENDAK